MSPVGQDQSNVKAPSNTGGAFSGDTPGLFADTGDKPSCDAQTLMANLAADTTKATAWATALGLQSTDIPTYVASLTPVVLRSDTAVTSYGYADNRFFAYPAVLQAGTSVFVNSYGEPKAKCFSGNPLTKAVPNPQASYVGPAWEQFAPASVTIIQRSTTVINNYTLVGVSDTTRVYHRRSTPSRHNDAKGACDNHPDTAQCKGVQEGVVKQDSGSSTGGDKHPGANNPNNSNPNNSNPNNSNKPNDKDNPNNNDNPNNPNNSNNDKHGDKHSDKHGGN